MPFEALFRKFSVKAGGVLHLGANEGQEAEDYNRQGISRVIWVEALLPIWQKLCQNTGRYPGHVCLAACVSDVTGETVKFHVANNGAQSSSFLEFGTHSKEHPSVKFIRDIEMTTIRVDDLLRKRSLSVGPHWFLNIDLQGAELKALKGMGSLLWEFDYAYIEVNEKELYVGCPLKQEIDEYLAQHGLYPRVVKMTGAGWGDCFYTRGSA